MTSPLLRQTQNLQRDSGSDVAVVPLADVFVFAVDEPGQAAAGDVAVEALVALKALAAVGDVAAAVAGGRALAGAQLAVDEIVDAVAVGDDVHYQRRFQLALVGYAFFSLLALTASLQTGQPLYDAM